ncbi:MAG: hypothetical protein JSV91_06325 [Phycisphaerales bacterium]|nr:MAG: hypothetical protein JSV91_06325 [Phycisphaerales bacterium]
MIAMAYALTAGGTELAFALPGGAEWILLVFVVLLSFNLVVAIVICALLHGCFSRIPPQHCRMTPGLVWLLLIPLFSCAWNFLVFLRLPESYQSYFAANGRIDVGDCGRSLGLSYAVLSAVAVVGGCIPIVSCVTGLAELAALVVLILFLVRVLTLKGQINGAPFAPSAPEPPPA